MSTESPVVLNDVCLENACPNYIEWEYSFDEEEMPVQCVSCTQLGESHDIKAYPDTCTYIKAIQAFIAEREDEREQPIAYEGDLDIPF
jgi:hypothetical protein